MRRVYRVRVGKWGVSVEEGYRRSGSIVKRGGDVSGEPGVVLHVS